LRRSIAGCAARLSDLVDGHYRKYLSRLHEWLGEARLNVVRAFERLGLFVEPVDGIFVWADSSQRLFVASNCV
jgi:hypothetical protein